MFYEIGIIDNVVIYAGCVILQDNNQNSLQLIFATKENNKYLEFESYDIVKYDDNVSYEMLLKAKEKADLYLQNNKLSTDIDYYALQVDCIINNEIDNIIYKNMR